MAGTSASEPANQPASKQAAIRSTLANLPLVFEPNRGQADPQVSFLARGGGYTLFLTRREAVVALSGSAPIRIRPSCAQEPQAIDGLEPTGGISNYFIGNDPARWTTEVPNYRKVQYTSVCPGVDVTYYGNPQKLEYDFTLSAWTDPRTVQVEYEGAESVRLAANGDLIVKTASGELVQHKPRAYQVIGGRQVQVEAGYRLTKGNRVEFALARYNRQQPLVIDPVLVYSTYLGGTGGDVGNSIAVDSLGNAYVTGHTRSINFPTASPRQPASGGGIGDAFVAKISANGLTKLYSTYLGGELDDTGFGIAVDASFNAYVVGQTLSTLFPVVTATAFQPSISVLEDAFVTKLNPSGSALLYSTYLGGTGTEQGAGIAVDNTGNAYVTGLTNSLNFPTTAGAGQTVNHSLLGANNVFVTKLNTTLTGNASLVYSTYLGGTADDEGRAIAVDGTGNAYVTGSVTSSDFPRVTGSYLTVKPSPASLSSAFVTKLNAAGTGLVFSTFLGGTLSDFGTGIAVDTTGTYVTGGASSLNFPVVNPIQAANGGGVAGGVDAFVTKLNPAGNALVYSTYLGGVLTDRANGIAVDSSGIAYVVGNTGSSFFPTQNALFTTGSIFVSALNPVGNTLAYSTFLSGGANDVGSGIAATPAGKVYVTGLTNSSSFPILNATQPLLGGGNGGPGNAFVTVIALVANQPPTVVSVTPASGSGTSGSFQFVVSSAAGFTDIATMEAIIGPIGASGCYLHYERAANRLFLVSDAGTVFTGPVTPGGAGTLSNSQCSLSAAGVTAVGAGNTLTLTVPLVFTAAFAGVKNVFLWAASVGGLTSGYQQVGTWTVGGASAVPTVVSVTPASGSGASGSFQFVVSSAAGFTDIATMEAIIGPIGAQSCYLHYERAANRLFLVSDAGTQFMGPVTPGGAGTLSNSQCSLSAAGVTAVGTGNTVTLTVPLVFTVAFAGAKGVYLWAASVGGLTSGYQQVGTWTVTGASSVPTAVSVTPASGSGASGSFQFVVSSAAGFANIATMEAIIGPIGALGCYLHYERATNRLFLLNDAGTLFTGPVTPGVAGTLSNSQCNLNAGGVTAVGAGNTVTLTVPLVFAAAFAGAKNVFLWAASVGGQTSGYQQVGTWTVTGASAAPTAVSVTPASGSGASGSFQFVVSSAAGFANIAAMEAIVGPIGAQSCYLRYERATNRLFLLNDAGTLFTGPVTPGVAGTLSNSQCSLSAAGATAVGSGTTLTLMAPLVFTGAFAGAKNVFLWAVSVGGQTSGYQQVGTWTVTGASAAPTVVSVTPATGSGASGNFQFVVSSTAGFANIAAMEAIIGPIGAQSCYLRYERATNRLFLVNDAGTLFTGPVTPGGAGTLSNSQCSLSAAGVTAVGTGNTVTLTVPLVFTVAFAGAKNVFLWAASVGGQTSGYQQVGTWTRP